MTQELIFYFGNTCITQISYIYFGYYYLEKFKSDNLQSEKYGIRAVKIKQLNECGR